MHLRSLNSAAARCQKKLFHNRNSSRATTNETLIAKCLLPHHVLLNHGPTFNVIFCSVAFIPEAAADDAA